MKVFALTLLLISICYVQGGLVKRQAEEEPQAEVPNVLTAQFTEFIRRLQQDTEGFASSIQEKFGQTTVERIRTQFETAFQQFQDSLTPLTEQMRQHVDRLFPRPTQQATEDAA
ncbi:apolipoprotein A-II [Pituophis catenifer annectens]|uniref:apolipoprotein A-II n=1 Tax=Pituophis catenifer annectens TaxID=94852 RepID=UPI003996C29A